MKETEIEFDLLQMLRLLWKKGWILLLASILGGCAALTGTYFLVEPQYQSTVTLYVEESPSGKALGDSFSVIVKLQESLQDVIQCTGSGRSYEELQKMISVTSVDGTDFVEITVTAPKAFEAQYLASAIGDNLPLQAAEIMEKTYFKVVGEAVCPEKPISPSYPNNALLGSVIGAMLALAAILLQPIIKKIRSD